MINRRRIIIGAGGCAALAVSGPVTRAFAQSAFAAGKVVRVMVGFPPGGSADIVARLIVDRLRTDLAMTVIVENRPGGGGRSMLEHARSQDTDGTVIALTPTGMLTIYPHVYRNLGYDTFRDFTSIGSAATYVTAITAGPSLPMGVRTLPEFVAWAMTLPQGASYGTPGSGTSMHFLGTMLSRRTGGRMTHVPYKGTAPMIQDLLGGQIPLGLAPVPDAVPHVRSGKLRVLATTGTRRSKVLPDTPTATEAGFTEIVAEDYFAMFVSARTPADVIDKLGAALRDALKSVAVLERLSQLGLEARATTPAEMNDIVRAQFNAWQPVVKASGFTVLE